jgi:hypothetical protein
MMEQIAALGRELDKEVTSGRALRSKLRDVTRKLAAYERTGTTTANTSAGASALRGGIAARSSRYIHTYYHVHSSAIKYVLVTVHPSDALCSVYQCSIRLLLLAVSGGSVAHGTSASILLDMQQLLWRGSHLDQSRAVVQLMYTKSFAIMYQRDNITDYS